MSDIGIRLRHEEDTPREAMRVLRVMNEKQWSQSSVGSSESMVSVI